MSAAAYRQVICQKRLKLRMNIKAYNSLIIVGVIAAGLGVAWFRVTVSLQGTITSLLMIIVGVALAIISEVQLKGKTKNKSDIES